MSSLVVIGVDLAGPSNADGTAAGVFAAEGDRLVLRAVVSPASDQDLAEAVAAVPLRTRLVIGLDAPLSYEPGGGQRAADADLRSRLCEKQMPPGCVMAPTFRHMAYLTLRGVSVARLAASIRQDAAIAEVHPSGAMVLRGASVKAVREMKRDGRSRTLLLRWLCTQGLSGIDTHAPVTDHYLCACACALAAWHWQSGTPVWRAPAAPPHHPFDFVC